MAKAKILADRISITSEILTDENIEKDETKALYEVSNGVCNTFTSYGAVFNDGKTLGAIDESILSLDKEEKEAKIKTILTAVLTRINAIEAQVEEYLEDAIDLSEDVEFLD